MFRTIKLKLPYDKSFLEMGRQFMEACHIALDYGFLEHTYNKNKLNMEIYQDARKAILTLLSGLVQATRDTASESLKQVKLMTEIRRNSLTIRYNRRTFRFYPDAHTLSLATVHGRLVFLIAHPPIDEKYMGEYTFAQVLIDNKHRGISVMIQVKLPDKEMERKILGGIQTIGIDRRIKNIAVLSNNKFLNSAHLKEVKGRYRYNKKKLQHAGTRSAHRKLSLNSSIYT